MSDFKLFCLLAGVSLLAACADSKGPGEIGSVNDIVIRNAGEPPIPTASAITAAPETGAEENVDPVVAAHDAAAAKAKADMVEKTKADPANANDKPVPGEPDLKTLEKEAAVEPVPAPAPAPAIETAPTVAEQEMTTDVPAAMEDKKPMAEDLIGAKPQILRVPVEPEKAPANDVATATPPAQTPAPALVEVTEDMVPVAENKPLQPVTEEVKAAAPEAVPVTAPVVSSGRTGKILNPTSALVKEVQKSLGQKGYYFGAADGNVGAEFLNALYLYQNAHGMKSLGLTYEVVESLGVSTAGL